MYLAKPIDDILESIKDDLLDQRVTHTKLTRILQKAFKQHAEFKSLRFRHETYYDLIKSQYVISGMYDYDKQVRYIIINLPRTRKTFDLAKYMWRIFKFDISAAIQHESIHESQWSLRNDIPVDDGVKIEFRESKGSVEQERSYLSAKDEIDAFAHDIAMEIKFYYNKEDPHHILRRIHTYKKLTSFQYYARTFKGDDWDAIKHRLLKKIYLWLPYVQVY